CVELTQCLANPTREQPNHRKGPIWDPVGFCQSAMGRTAMIFAQFSPGAEMFVLINPGSRRNAKGQCCWSMAVAIPNQRTEDFGGAWPTPILVAMAVPVSRVLPSVGHRSATLLLGEQGLQSKV